MRSSVVTSSGGESSDALVSCSTSPQHDGYAGIDAGNGAWKDQRDLALNSRITEGYQNMS